MATVYCFKCNDKIKALPEKTCCKLAVLDYQGWILYLNTPEEDFYNLCPECATVAGLGTENTKWRIKQRKLLEIILEKGTH